MNSSPWLYQLNRTRSAVTLKDKQKTDVAIIGGGIAGIATAYYTLKNTKKNVILVEAGKIAHGATGHNGGFLASYFERTFSSLVQEFGLDMAAKAQHSMESAWILLDQIRQDASIQTPVWQFTGYTGCATLEEIIIHLRNNALREKAGITSPVIMVSEEASCLRDIPDIYKKFYIVVPKQDVLSLLETQDQDYIAVLPSRKGCMNSAQFCEELISYLLSTYSSRFTVAEHTLVSKLVLKKRSALLYINEHLTMSAKKVILCTNGFEKIDIINPIGHEINKKFHQLVRGIVGYMAGYVEELKKPPTEISYLPKKGNHMLDIYEEEPYFYLTRRPFDIEKKHNLICVGGPETLMDDTNNYQKEHPYPSEAQQQIDDFLKYTYKHGPGDNITHKFFWHGLMGFTPNGIRLIGPEPCNPVLYYNLGCNGVGLLPSIYGGQKISWHLSGKKVEPSIFDPKDSSQHKHHKSRVKRMRFRKVQL